MFCTRQKLKKSCMQDRWSQCSLRDFFARAQCFQKVMHQNRKHCVKLLPASPDVGINQSLVDIPTFGKSAIKMPSAKLHRDGGQCFPEDLPVQEGLNVLEPRNSTNSVIFYAFISNSHNS